MPITNHHRKFNVSADDLRKMYLVEGRKSRDIAKEYGVSKGTVHNWLTTYGIQRRKNENSVVMDEKRAVDLYVNHHWTCRQIGKEMGCHPNTVAARISQLGVQLTNEQRTARHRELNRRKYPGRTICNKGYVRVIQHDNPNAYAEGYMMEHRVVIERAIGRPLDKKETIHHINMNRADNRIENLALMQNQHDHFGSHKYMERIGLFHCGMADKPTPLKFKNEVFWAGKWIKTLDLLSGRNCDEISVGAIHAAQVRETRAYVN